MPVDIIKSFLSACGPDQYLDYRIASQCAPVLKGAKISNMVTVPPGSWNYIRRALRGSGVICIILSADKEKEILLLYRYSMLEECLKQADVRRFLSGLGYHDLDVASLILRLRARYRDYVAGGVFPHELGIILQYPVKDVESFMKYGGRGCLMSGYWKVYHDAERAKAVFRQYDILKEQASKEAMKGCSLREIVRV